MTKMTPEEQIDFVRFLFDQWKAERKELIVYNIALDIIQSENPSLKPVLDKLLENARNSEAVRKFAESRFEGLEELIDSMGEGSLEKVVREFREKYGSKLPIN
jgi:DNA phosphorothioation-dependent restriction protein DptG